MRNTSSNQKTRHGSQASAHARAGAHSRQFQPAIGYRSPDAFVKQQSENVVTAAAPADAHAVQRALPHDGLANTKGYYNSQSGAKNKKYEGGRPVNFSTKFKMDMVKNEWQGSYNSVTDMWYVESVGESGVVLPTNAIQIDHTVPWDSIEEKLKEDPSSVLSGSDLSKAKLAGYVMPNGKNYTLYAARMYYHDVPNLKPWAGSENASKGKNFEATKVSKHDAMSNKLARSGGIHHEMVTAARQAYREWGTYDDDVKTMMGQIDNADKAMSAAADTLNGM